VEPSFDGRQVRGDRGQRYRTAICQVRRNEVGLSFMESLDTAFGSRCIITRSSYTEKEDFTGADAVYDCIGDAGDERFSLEDISLEVSQTS